MNATEQANNPYLAGKISQLGSIFKQEFPEAKVDLAPLLFLIPVLFCRLSGRRMP